MSEIRAKIALGAGFASLAAGTALAVAWALTAGTIPDWSSVSSIRPGDARGAYPLRITLPPSDAAAPTMAQVTSPPADPLFDQKEADEPGVLPPPPPTESTVRVAAANPKPAPIPRGFDIRNFGTGGAESGELIRTTKPVILGGNPLGAIELAVGQGASVSVDRKALSELLGDRAPALSAALEREKSDRVTLETLRTRDVAIRYDPLSDALVIDTRL